MSLKRSWFQFVAIIRKRSVLLLKETCRSRNPFMLVKKTVQWITREVDYDMRSMLNPPKGRKINLYTYKSIFPCVKSFYPFNPEYRSI